MTRAAVPVIDMFYRKTALRTEQTFATSGAAVWHTPRTGVVVFDYRTNLFANCVENWAAAWYTPQFVRIMVRSSVRSHMLDGLGSRIYSADN